MSLYVIGNTVARSAECQKYSEAFQIVSQRCKSGEAMSENTLIKPRLLKTSHAARYLGVSGWKLRNLVQSGEIPCILGDGTSPWLFDLQDLDKWIERRKQTL